MNDKVVNRINSMVHLNLYSTGTATGLYLMSETGTNVKTYIGYTQEMIRRIAEVLQAVFLDGLRGVNCSLQVNCSLFVFAKDWICR